MSAMLAQAAPLSGGQRLLAMLLAGISLGAIYALLAMGFVIIFKATQVINFAHGALAALGAFLVASFATLINFPGRFLGGAPGWAQWVVSALAALLASAVVGIVLERLFIRPMVGEALFSVAIITLGMDIVVRTVTNDFIGGDPRPLGTPWGVTVVEVGPVSVPLSEIIQISVAVTLMVLVALFFRTRTGVAMRATAFDQEAAQAQGINVGRIFSIAWAIGALLAAVAGIFASIFPRSTGVNNFTAFFAFRAFPAIILGGLDSVVGAVLGGFIIGLAESAAGTYLAGPRFQWLGSGFAGVVPYIVMLMVLLIRPYGLLGTEEIRRV
jgi:branched-chain amino acid transport system permease protein